jgi:L-iditol 2-dehydrogenase
LKVPQSTPLEEATLFEPFACVVRSVLEVSTIRAGDTVLVCGPGTIGQLVAQVARVAGGTVYVAGTTSDADRLALAEANGAARTFVVSDQVALDRVKEETGPYGFDVVYECSGAAPAIDLCINLVRKQGQYVQVGLFGKNVPVDFDTVLRKELQILSSFGTKMSSWERAITLVSSGAVSLKPYVSEVLPLSDWQRGFARAIRREGYKILLDPATNRT